MMMFRLLDSGFEMTDSERPKEEREALNLTGRPGPVPLHT